MLRALNQEIEPHRIDSPRREDIVAAISKLDGKTRTLLILELGDVHHMGVGGGAERFVVYQTVDNREFRNLVDPTKTGKRISLICGGQEGEFDAKQCVGLDLALRAAAYFFDHGTDDPSLTWEDG